MRRNVRISADPAFWAPSGEEHFVSLGYPSCDSVRAVTWRPGGFSLMRELGEVSWIALDSWQESGSTTVTSVAPRGFASYVRILHPASSPAGSRSWATVAAATGRTMHPLVQWEQISSGEYTTGRWHAPRAGEPPIEVLVRLSSTVRAFTSTPTRCFFAIWDGWGQLHSRSLVVLRSAASRLRPRSKKESTSVEAFVAERENEIRSYPRFEFEPGTGREYLLGTGPLDALLEIADDRSHVRPGVPVSMWWPGDHAWFAASEIDLDSTLVGGSIKLRSALLADDHLEAFEVPPDGVLSAGGDTINPP